MQVNPNEVIQLTALINDTGDSTLYYVQAVVRSSSNGKVLDTIKLTRDSVLTRRFTGSTRAPAATGVSGYWIDVTTTIYTDAAYTVKAGIYPEIIDKYLVAPRWTVAQGGGGNGDPFINQYRNDGTRSVIREEFATLMEEIGKIGTPTVVVEGTKTKTTVQKVDTTEIQRKLEESVARALSQKGKAVSKTIGDMPEIKAMMETFKTFPDMLAKLKELENKFSYLFEHEYLTRMMGDGSLLPPESSETGRQPSKGIIPVADVMKAHAERRASIFDGTGPAPASADTSGGLLPPESTPGASRAPSDGVFPNHVVAAHQEAAARIAQPEVPSAPASPLPPDFTLPKANRKPSDGVFPNHVVVGNRSAMAHL